jgi:hypothetical protein
MFSNVEVRSPFAFEWARDENEGRQEAGDEVEEDESSG